jgi:hypothetical protein
MLSVLWISALGRTSILSFQLYCGKTRWKEMQRRAIFLRNHESGLGAVVVRPAGFFPLQHPPSPATVNVALFRRPLGIKSSPRQFGRSQASGVRTSRCALRGAVSGCRFLAAATRGEPPEERSLCPHKRRLYFTCAHPRDARVCSRYLPESRSNQRWRLQPASTLPASTARQV